MFIHCETWKHIMLGKKSLLVHNLKQIFSAVVLNQIEMSGAFICVCVSHPVRQHWTSIKMIVAKV